MSVLLLLGNKLWGLNILMSQVPITTLLLCFVIKVTWRKHRSMRSLLMLLFYLAYLASLLETSDDNENPRAPNRARRNKDMRLSSRVMQGYGEFSSLLLQYSTNYTRALFTIPNIILSLFPCILFPMSPHHSHCWS